MRHKYSMTRLAWPLSLAHRRRRREGRGRKGRSMRCTCWSACSCPQVRLPAACRRWRQVLVALGASVAFSLPGCQPAGLSLVSSLSSCPRPLSWLNLPSRPSPTTSPTDPIRTPPWGAQRTRPVPCVLHLTQALPPSLPPSRPPTSVSLSLSFPPAHPASTAATSGTSDGGAAQPAGDGVRAGHASAGENASVSGHRCATGGGGHVENGGGGRTSVEAAMAALPGDAWLLVFDRVFWALQRGLLPVPSSVSSLRT